MSTLREFLAMGGYGLYVWSAYGIWLAVMAWNVAWPLLRHRRVARRLRDTVARGVS